MRFGFAGATTGRTIERRALGALIAWTLAAGCGVPASEHAALRRDFERVRAESARVARRCEDGGVEARRHLDVCDAARTEAEARVRVLDQEVLAARRARGELAGALRDVEAQMHALRSAGDAPASLRRRRTDVLERFRVLAEGLPELADVSPTLVADRVVVALPAAQLSGEAWDRIAEVLRGTPHARWSVEVRAQEWSAATAAAAMACAALVERGVDASRLRAVGRRGGKPGPMWRGLILEEGVDVGEAVHAPPAASSPAPPDGAAPSAPRPAPGP